MKRFFKRILGIISVLILGYQQFCYADVIKSDPIIDEFKPIAFLIGFIGVIVLIITSISFFSLRSTTKKQSETEADFRNVNNEKIEKKNNRIQRIFYMWGMILAIVSLIYLALSNEISRIPFFIPIILFIVSLIARMTEKKKVSNIICGISVALVCIIALWVGVSNKLIENYNKQFSQYLEYEKTGRYSSPREEESVTYVSDVEGLINTAIKNNKRGRKTTIIYQDVNYTSIEELKQLLSKLNTGEKYYYDAYSSNHDYIESIKLTLPIKKQLQEYEGKQKGSVVKSLIQIAYKKGGNLHYGDGEIYITYIPETNQKTTIRIIEINSQVITSLIDKIESTKTYNVEIQTIYKYDNNIIITSNN